MHGSLANLECHLCHEAYQWDDYRRDIEDHKMEEGGEDDCLRLPCPRCNGRCEARKKAGMRPLPIGQLRPSMIMLGQAHPDGDEIAHLARCDGSAGPDLLLVLGTSLKVDGPKRLFQQFARRVRKQAGKVIYVNLSEPPSKCSTFIDYWVKWDVEEWVQDLKGKQDHPGTRVRKRGLVKRGRAGRRRSASTALG